MRAFLALVLTLWVAVRPANLWASEFVRSFSHGGSWMSALGEMAATIVYGLIGICLAILGYIAFDKITPFSVTKEIEEDQNISLAIIIGSLILGSSIIVATAISS